MLFYFWLLACVGALLGFAVLPDAEASYRMLLVFCGLVAVAGAYLYLARLFSRLFKRGRLAEPTRFAPFDDDLSSRATDTRSDFSRSGIDSYSPDLSWQYRVNDQRLGRFE